VGDGLAIFDKRSGSFEKLNVDTAQGVGVRSGYIYDLVRFSDGLIWGGSNGGVFTVDPVTLKLNGFRNHPVLKEIYGKRVLSMY
jgi:hypothetical protein